MNQGYSCEICGNKYAVKAHYDHHVAKGKDGCIRKHPFTRVYEDGIKFKCNYCSKIFTRKYNVQQHQNTSCKKKDEFLPYADPSK